MTVPEFQRHKLTGKKLVVVTAYDALFTRIVEQAGIEAILVGDSLGVVVQGKKDTLTVTMDERGPGSPIDRVADSGGSPRAGCGDRDRRPNH